MTASTADLFAAHAPATTRLAAARAWLASEGHSTDESMCRAAAKELTRPRDYLHSRWAECVLEWLGVEEIAVIEEALRVVSGRCEHCGEELGDYYGDRYTCGNCFGG